MPKPSPLTAALEAFEAAETNLISLEHLWIEIERLIPSGVQDSSVELCIEPLPHVCCEVSSEINDIFEYCEGLVGRNFVIRMSFGVLSLH